AGAGRAHPQGIESFATESAFPLAYREKNANFSSLIPYPPLGNRYEQTRRPRPGHPRPAAPEDPRARAAARLGHQPAPALTLLRRPAGLGGIALPGAPQARAGGLDPGRVEADREQPPREVLFADAPGPPAARDGGRELAAPVRRHLVPRAALRGVRKTRC